MAYGYDNRCMYMANGSLSCDPFGQRKEVHVETFANTPPPPSTMAMRTTMGRDPVTKSRKLMIKDLAHVYGFSVPAGMVARFTLNLRVDNPTAINLMLGKLLNQALTTSPPGVFAKAQFGMLQFQPSFTWTFRANTSIDITIPKAVRDLASTVVALAKRCPNSIIPAIMQSHIVIEPKPSVDMRGIWDLKKEEVDALLNLVALFNQPDVAKQNDAKIAKLRSAPCSDFDIPVAPITQMLGQANSSSSSTAPVTRDISSIGLRDTFVSDRESEDFIDALVSKYVPAWMRS
jgi:hypothetical protein